MTPTLRRRALLLLLVCLSASQIPGCATTEAQRICDVQTYSAPVVIPDKGSVHLTWEYRQDLREGRYGLATCDRQGKHCHLTIRRVPGWNQVCEGYDFYHEVLHALGAAHE
jgi:hypothetical protein